MKIQSIALYNYRNYPQLNLNLSTNVNIFTGLNAQGKTNIIEAVHFAAIGISHRTRNENELIYWGEKNATINIKFSRRQILSNLKFYLQKGTHKKIEFNGEFIKQKNLPGILTMILFSPEDLMLIKGSPIMRRRFLDIELSQIDLRYYAELVKYNKILSQRNNLLKKLRENNSFIDMLDTWDEQFAKSASFIVAKRLNGINILNNLVQKIHKSISNGTENLTIKYLMHKNNEIKNTIDNNILYNWFKDNLKKYREKDIFRGSSSIGPHRDDIDFFINEINLKSFGSQGQQRSSVLSLKLAELNFLKQETGEYPVLLLDDVMSELDSNRRNNLLLFLQEKNIQTIITATDRDLFKQNDKNKFFTVNNGIVLAK